MTNILFCNKMGNQTNRFALFLILILPLLYRIMDFQVAETDALLLAIYNCASVTCYGQKRGARNKSSKNYFSGTLKKKGLLVMQSFSAHPIQPPDTSEET